MQKQITIIGGGPVGLSCALGLAKLGFNLAIIDSAQNKANDGRVLALSQGSDLILKRLGVKLNQQITPIKQIHISHSGLGITKIHASDLNLDKLGYTVPYTYVCECLEYEVSQNLNIKLINGIVTSINPNQNLVHLKYTCNNQPHNLDSDLVIVAEGGKIKIDQIDYQEFDYKSLALIAKLDIENYQEGLAFERFDQSGALVLLPHNGYYVLVWSLPTEIATNIINNNSLEDKLREIGFFKRFGKITLKDKMHSFPLRLRIATPKALNNLVLIGNSSQIVHPVAAQGLNLGLRDVMDLLDSFKHQSNHSNLFDNYQKMRKLDSKLTIGFTHFLANYLDRDYFNSLNSLGIIALSNCQSLQNKIANTLVFGM